VTGGDARQAKLKRFGGVVYLYDEALPIQASSGSPSGRRELHWHWHIMRRQCSESQLHRDDSSSISFAFDGGAFSPGTTRRRRPSRSPAVPLDRRRKRLRRASLSLSDGRRRRSPWRKRQRGRTTRGGKRRGQQEQGLGRIARSQTQRSKCRRWRRRGRPLRRQPPPRRRSARRRKWPSGTIISRRPVIDRCEQSKQQGC